MIHTAGYFWGWEHIELFLRFLVCLPSDCTFSLLIYNMLCHVHRGLIHSISGQEYLSVSSGTNCTERVENNYCNPAEHKATGHVAQFSQVSSLTPGPTQLPVQWVLRVLCASSSWCMPVTSHPHLVPRLRVNGASPSLLLYTLMACTRTAVLTHCGFAAQI
jgi:hypothetical protein